MSGRCDCRCGYSCDRKCGLEIMACIDAHYRRDCDHDFTDEMVHHSTPGGGSTSSVTCVHCGMEALDHDMAVGP